MGDDKSAKHCRRDLLCKRLDANVLFFEKNNWICISKIKKTDFNEEKEYSNILNKFINDFITYSLAIEEIINEKWIPETKYSHCIE